MIKIADRYRDKGLVVLAVNAWGEPADRVRSFVKDAKINYTVLLDGGDAADKFGVRGIPATFYIDREGKIRSMNAGLESESSIEGQVKAILVDSPPSSRG